MQGGQQITWTIMIEKLASCRFITHVKQKSIKPNLKVEKGGQLKENLASKSNHNKGVNQRKKNALK